MSLAYYRKFYSVLLKIFTFANAKIALVVVFLAFISVLFMINIWADQSLSFASPLTSAEAVYQNGSIVNKMRTVIVVENYFPQTYYDTIKMNLFANQTDRSSWIPISLNASTLVAQNISIGVYSVSYSYAGEELQNPAPVRMVNPPSLEGFVVAPLAKTTVSFDWSYVTNETSNRSYDVFVPMTELGERSVFQEFAVNTQLFFHSWPLLWVFPLYSLLAYSFFMLLGWAYSWAILRDASGLAGAYRHLTVLKQMIQGEVKEVKEGKKEKSSETVCGYLLASDAMSEREKKENKLNEDIGETLRELKYFPNQLNSFNRIILGPSVLVFKLSVNSWCRYLKETCARLRREKLESSLGAYPEESATKVQDLVPETKTVVTFLGFLTAIGISFSWNIGAIVPLLFSLGLFYFFFNVGSAVQLIWRSYKDLVWIIILIVIAIFVIHYSSIINSLR